MERLKALGRARWALLLGGALVLWAPTASAAPTAAMREAARKLMDEGKDRTAHNDLPRALEAYKSAHELMHVPTTGLAVARTLASMGQLLEARDTANEVAQIPPEEGEHPAFGEAREKAKALASDLTNHRIPRIQISVKGGAPKTVTLDDKELSLPLSSDGTMVNPGSHVVTAVDADGKQNRERVEVAERDTKKVELALPEAAGKVAPGDESGPPAETSKSGERTGAAKVLIYGGFGVAVVGLGVGAVTGLMSLSKADQVKPQCENNICAPDSKPSLDSALTMASVSTVGFAAMGIGAAAGIVGLLLPRKSSDAPAPPTPTTEGFTGLMIGAGTVGYRGTF